MRLTTVGDWAGTPMSCGPCSYNSRLPNSTPLQQFSFLWNGVSETLDVTYLGFLNEFCGCICVCTSARLLISLGPWKF